MISRVEVMKERANKYYACKKYDLAVKYWLTADAQLAPVLNDELYGDLLKGCNARVWKRVNELMYILKTNGAVANWALAKNYLSTDKLDLPDPSVIAKDGIKSEGRLTVRALLRPALKCDTLAQAYGDDMRLQDIWEPSQSQKNRQSARLVLIRLALTVFGEDPYEDFVTYVMG